MLAEGLSQLLHLSNFDSDKVGCDICSRPGRWCLLCLHYEEQLLRWINPFGCKASTCGSRSLPTWARGQRCEFYFLCCQRFRQAEDTPWTKKWGSLADKNITICYFSTRAKKMPFLFKKLSLFFLLFWSLMKFVIPKVSPVKISWIHLKSRKQ